MKNIKQIELEKYRDNPRYEAVENKIYKDLEDDGYYVFAISYELEEDDDSQYPLEHILDNYLLHVSDFLGNENFTELRSLSLELSGRQNDIFRAVEEIIGKRIYYKDMIDPDDGEIYAEFTIE